MADIDKCLAYTQEVEQLRFVNKQLKAHIARLEQACELYDVELGNMGISCHEADAVVNETPQQGLASIQADAVEKMTVALGKKNGGVGSYCFQPLKHEEILEYVQQLRQQGEK